MQRCFTFHSCTRNQITTLSVLFSFLHQELDHNTFCSLVSIPFLSQEGNSSGSAFGWDYRALYLVAFSCDQVTWSVFPMPGWILPQTALPISKIKTMREKNFLEVSPLNSYFSHRKCCNVGGFFEKKPKHGNSKLKVYCKVRKVPLCALMKKNCLKNLGSSEHLICACFVRQLNSKRI